MPTFKDETEISFFRAMQDSAQAFGARTLDGRIVFLNQAYADLTGYSAEVLQSSIRAADLTPAEWREREKPYFDALLETKKPQEYEKEYLRKDGTRVPVKVKIHLHTLPNGEICYFGFFEDITSQKNSERDLKLQYEKLTATEKDTGEMRRRLNSALIAGEVGTFEWDVRTNALFGDRNFCRIFNIQADPSIPKPIELFMNAIHPEDRARVAELVKKTVDTGVDYEAEYRIIVDGEVRWLVARGKGEVEPQTGKVIRFPGAVLEISKQKRIEEALHRQERLYESILNNTPDLAYIFDLDHRFIYANEILLKMWGKTWDEAIGKNCLELGYEPWHAEMHSREIEEVKATKKMVRGEVPFEGTFGRRTYDYILVPVIGPNGEVEAVAGTTRDVTERKLQDQRKDEFLATLAHELRNPLAPIKTGLQILKIGTGEAAEKAREMMERQLVHLVRLVDDLMDISRVSRGQIELRFQQIELRKIIDLALETSRPLIQEGNHNLDLAIGEGSYWLNADITRLSQVLSNLLNNAAKYTPKGGRISLSVYEDNGNVFIKIADNGAGIPQDMLHDVFDLFTQVGQSIDRSQGGLGIGLSLVKRLVEMHEGEVWAESPGLGKGSEFTVKIPLLPASEKNETTYAGTSPQTTQLKPNIRKVLIVDDNKDGAESLSALLEFSGHETQTAHSGTEALAMMEKFKPDVVFLDIGLPDMNGYEVAQEIKKNERLKDIVLVALTGWGSSEDKKKSFESGFNFHLTKPMDIDQAESILANL